MEAVPADIIEEILVRLAVKSLMRFKCVSRRWCALIQSRRFTHRHYSHDTNQDRLVFKTGEYVDDRFEEGHGDRLLLPYFDKNIQHRIMGAVMGLLCGLSVFGEIVLLNPATHKVKRVPPLPFVFECWVFDLIFGFGLDPWSGDYKIVVFGGEAVWVYNSSSDCWKRVDGSCSAMKTVRNRDCRNGAFSNGVYYWLVMTMNGHGKGILGFDMMSEKFREIKVPDALCYPEISAYGDSIAVMSRLDVWVMGEEGVWRRRWKLRRRLWWPVFFWKGEVMLVCNQGEGSRVQLIHLSTRKVTSIDDEFNDRVIIPFIPCPFCYKESLVSIQGEQDV